MISKKLFDIETVYILKNNLKKKKEISYIYNLQELGDLLKNPLNIDKINLYSDYNLTKYINEDKAVINIKKIDI